MKPSARKRNRCRMPLLLLAGIACLAGPAQGELQSVEVGGKIEIYGAWYSDFYEPSGGAIRIPSFFLLLRPVGPDGTVSAIRAGDGGNNVHFAEQRTRLHVNAAFTSSVNAFLEFDSIDTWGEDFRSDYLTGADFRADTADDVELYQAYIELAPIGGLPLHLRIGRQELEFGSGWLVGADPGPDPFVGLSFDAVRLSYIEDAFSVHAWWSKLAESSPLEEDGDVDFYGIYVTLRKTGSDMRTKPLRPHELFHPAHLVYHGLMRLGPFRGRLAPAEDLVQLDAYWMYVRDAASRNDTNLDAFPERLEDTLGLDDYNVSHLHTVGTRGAGTWKHADWEVEVAYQWG